MRNLLASLTMTVALALPAPHLAHAAGATQPEGEKAAEEKAPEGEAAGSEAQDQDAKTRAKASFKAARAAFKEKKYKDALAGFEEAYGIDPHPVMLYNIALCQQKLGRPEDALDTLKRFLAEEPDSKARPKVEKKIAELEAKLKKEDESDEPGQQPAKPVPAKPGPGAEPGETPGKTAPVASVYNREGLSVYASIGYGSLSSDQRDKSNNLLFDFSPSVAVGVGVEHRPLDFLSYGMRMTWSALGVSSPYSSINPDSAFFFEAAGLAEFWPLALFMEWSRFDPFIGLGVGYGQVTVNIPNNTWNYYGATLHLSMGVHVFVNSWISVGGVLSYKAGFWTSVCDSSGCLDAADMDPDFKGSLPSMISLGAEGSFHFL